MKITIDDTDHVELLRILKEKKAKHEKLHRLAKQRNTKNSERLMSKHKAKAETADKIFKKIVAQI